MAIWTWDASLGLFLKGNGHGKFQPFPYRKEGVLLESDVKAMCVVTGTKNQKMIVVGANDAPLRCLIVN